MGIKGFNTEQRNVTTTQIIKETLEVGSDGSVSFRARYGKGSGKPVEISGDQFDTFINLMNDIASRRETLAETARAEEVETTTDVTESDETTSE